MDLRSRWLGAWQALALSAPSGLLEALLERYREPHRRYHTLRHLEECFARLAEVRSLPEHPAEVELALWFHDAIYDTHRDDNERRSAEWAKASFSSGPVADRIHAMVMATRHAAVPAGIDAQVVVDVDLSILGAAAHRFDEYEAQIREEYGWVPRPIYRRKRRKILAAFLARAALFNTAHFAACYEVQARANLARALSRL